LLNCILDKPGERQAAAAAAATARCAVSHHRSTCHDDLGHGSGVEQQQQQRSSIDSKSRSQVRETNHIGAAAAANDRHACAGRACLNLL
jgi:hypothetical protein